MLEHLIYEKSNIKYPDHKEDFSYFNKEKSIFAVADGITRDFKKIEDYPKISGGRLAAETFCKEVVQFLSKGYGSLSEEKIKESMNFANQKIWELNEEFGINKKVDYLLNDYYGTVGAVMAVKNNQIFYGICGDCSFDLYDKNKKPIFISKDYVHRASMYLGCQWDDSECRVRWRKVLRNNPKLKNKGYGAFTGEKEAEFFYQIGKFKVNKDDVAFLYSDGLTHYFKISEFLDIFYKNGIKSKIENFCQKEEKKDYDKFGGERTLVVIKF